MSKKGQTYKTKTKLDIPEVGSTFGFWEVIENIPTKLDNCSGFYILCKCICGVSKYVAITNLLRGESLGCTCRRQLRKENGKLVGDISQTYFHAIKAGAINRNIEFNISKEYIWDVYLKQNKKCALSGVAITIAMVGKKNKEYKSLHTASLDRINSKLGYIEGNVQWVHKIINKMKMDIPNGDFIDFCNKIIIHQNIKNA